MTKHLDARGKGEVDYDYKHDTLFFKTKNREYKESLDFGNLVVDIDEENYIVGIQIFDASKTFNMDKTTLRDVKNWEFNAKIDNQVITIKLSFVAVKRNKFIGRQNFERETPTKLPNSEVLCTV